MALLAAALAGCAATVAASAGPTASVAQGELEGYNDRVRILSLADPHLPHLS